MPKRVTAIFYGTEQEAKSLLREAQFGDALTRVVNGSVGIQHPALDKLGEDGVENACLLAKFPLRIVITMRDFRDVGPRHGRGKGARLAVVPS